MYLSATCGYLQVKLCVTEPSLRAITCMYMDFLDPAKKRANGIKLFVGYALVGIGIVLATIILIFLSYGYSVDRKTGSLIQNGIVFLSSRPSDAGIFVDGEKYKDNTNARLVLPSGDYNLAIKKDKYRTWQRNLFLQGGTIERFVYPFLFPTDIPTNDVATYAVKPALTTQSPDRRWLLLQKQPTDTSFELYDLSDSPLTTETIAVPSSVLSSGTKSFAFVEWSNDNRHVLFEHNYSKGREFIIVDREQPNESINVTTLTKKKVDRVSLRDKKFDTWYLFDTDTQKLFFASEDTPTPKLLIEDVLDYKSHDTKIILYATNRKAERGQSRIIIWDDGRGSELRTLSRSSRYLLDVARFDDAWYYVAGGNKDGKVYVYKNPLTQENRKPGQPFAPATIMRLDSPRFVSFSQNTRFVAVQAGSTFSVYDAETERSYKYDAALPLGNQKLTWMDGHRLQGVVDQKAVVFDYDGTNQQFLLAAQPGTIPFFSQDYETLFTVAPKANSKEANLLQGDLVIP